jgi:uncharacterized glyoxalase superfamily protein PhnB
MKPTPKGWPRISVALYYKDSRKAIDWLCDAFGFEVRLKIEAEDGSIAHSELTFGEGMIMVGTERDASAERMRYARSPRSLDGANTQNMMIYVDDVMAHYERARAAGATIVSEPAVTDYGPDYWMDRGYETADPEGHHFWFYQRLRSPNS